MLLARMPSLSSFLSDLKPSNSRSTTKARDPPIAGARVDRGEDDEEVRPRSRW